MIIIFSTIILAMMVFLTILSKQVAKFAYKDLFITDIGSVEYNSKIFNKKATTGGVVPKQTYIKLNMMYLNFIIKIKVLYNKPLDKLEVLFYENYNFFKQNIVKNTSKFGKLLYINEYCRVIYIANAILKENKNKITELEVKNFINSYNIVLTYNECDSLEDAFRYQIAIYLNEYIKFVLHLDKMKNKARKKFNKKYSNSVIYCYYCGKYSNDFEKYFENISNLYNSYDEVVSKYFNIINNKIYNINAVINTLQFVQKNDFLSLYSGYNVLNNNEKTANITHDKKRDILQLNSSIAINENIDEFKSLYVAIEYANMVEKDVYFLLLNKDKKLVEYLTNKEQKKRCKKKL